MKKGFCFLLVLSLLLAFGVGLSASADDCRTESISWTDMNVRISTEVPSTWTKERRQQGYMNGISFFSPGREAMLFYACVWSSSDFTDENGDVIPRDSYDYIDELLKMACPDIIGDISHREIAGLKAGSVAYWEASTGRPVVFYVLAVYDDTFLLVQVADGNNKWTNTMEIVNHSLDSLVVSEIPEQS